MAPDFPVDPRYAEMDGMEAINFRFRRLRKINCWQRSEHENVAMWRIYADESKGVGITTTPDRLRTACKSFRLQPTYGVEDLWGGPVHYEDLTKVRLRLPGDQTYFCKHLPFYWEREFSWLKPFSLRNARTRSPSFRCICRSRLPVAIDSSVRTG